MIVFSRPPGRRRRAARLPKSYGPSPVGYGPQGGGQAEAGRFFSTIGAEPKPPDEK